MSGDKTSFRYGFESAEGVPWHDSTFVRFESEAFAMGRPYEADPNLDPSGQETEGDNLKAEGKGKLIAAPNSESFLRMRIAHRGYFEKTTPVAGVSRWTLRKAIEGVDTPVAQYIKSLWAGIWRDDGSEYNAMGARVTDFTATAPANKHLRFEHSFLYLRDRYMRNPSRQAVNAAYTGEMFARGHRRANDEAGDYYKFKVTVGGALDGTARIVWGKGVAAYGVTEYPVLATVWQPVYNADGSLAGTRREPIEWLPVPDVGDVLTVDDEWYIYPTSPKPVPSYSARPKLTAVESTVRFSRDGGTTWFTKVLKQFEIYGTIPHVADFGTGGKYAQQALDNGKEAWEFRFNRSYVDMDFLRALISGARFEIEAQFFGALIGVTGLEDYHKFTIPIAKATVAGAVISNPNQLPENVTLRAMSENNSSLCTEEIQNTVATITPTT